MVDFPVNMVKVTSLEKCQKEMFMLVTIFKKLRSSPKIKLEGYQHITSPKVNQGISIMGILQHPNLG